MALSQLESIRRDEWNHFKIHSVGEVSKWVQRVVVASLADRGRRPKPRPDVDHNENPDPLLLAPHDGSDLIRLKLRDGEFPLICDG